MCVTCLAGLGILSAIIIGWWTSWWLLPPALGLVLVGGYFLWEKDKLGKEFVLRKSVEKLLRVFKLCCHDDKKAQV